MYTWTQNTFRLFIRKCLKQAYFPTLTWVCLSPLRTWLQYSTTPLLTVLTSHQTDLFWECCTYLHKKLWEERSQLKCYRCNAGNMAIILQISICCCFYDCVLTPLSFNAHWNAVNDKWQKLLWNNSFLWHFKDIALTVYFNNTNFWDWKLGVPNEL